MQSVVYSGEDFFGKPNKVTAIVTTISTSFKVTLDDLLPIVEDFIRQTEARLVEQDRLPLYYWGHYVPLQERDAIAIQVTLHDGLFRKPHWFGARRLPLLGRVIVRPYKIVVQHFRHSDLPAGALSLAGAPIAKLLGKVSWWMPGETAEKGSMPKEMSEEIYEELSGDKFINGLIDYIRTEIGNATAQSGEAENEQAPQSEPPMMQEQAPAPSDVQETRKFTPEQKITVVLLVVGVVVAIGTCIAAWLVVPQVQEVIQPFRGAMPMLTPTLVFPAATP